MTRHPITTADAATQAAALANNERFCRDIGIEPQDFATCPNCGQPVPSLPVACVFGSHILDPKTHPPAVSKA